MNISVLGYNFAPFIKDFKKAFIQTDGTYDYMSYIAIVDPASFFMLANNLGNVDNANNHLNTLLTPTIKNISVVNPSETMKGGANFGSVLLTIALLFMFAIQSSLAQISHKEQRNLEEFYKENGVQKNPEKPQTVKGWFWDYPPTQEQQDDYTKAKSLFEQQEGLKKEVGMEEDQNETYKLNQELQNQSNEILSLSAIKFVEEAHKVADDSKDSFHRFQMAVTMLGAAGAIGFYVLYDKKQPNEPKNVRIPTVFIVNFAPFISALVKDKLAVIKDKEIFTTVTQYNLLSGTANNMMHGPNYIALPTRTQTANAREEIIKGQLQITNGEPLQITNGGKYRKTRKIRKTKNKKQKQKTKK